MWVFLCVCVCVHLFVCMYELKGMCVYIYALRQEVYTGYLP